VVSVVEATLEDPRPVLMAQQFKARGEAVAEMKADGVEYDERMELLDDVTWPKPLEELLEATYSIYARTHPWITESPLSPKTVVRDMYEQAMTFQEYVAAYGLTRSEGLLLRYLSDAYRALRQTVPDSVRTDELEDIQAWLGAVVRQTDSSLLDEWEQLTDPTLALARAREQADPLRPPEPERITANRRAFTVLVRNALFRRVELAALRRVDELEEGDGDVWAEPLADYFDEHDRIGTGPDARGPALFLVEESADTWAVQQILDDPEGHHDWRIVAEVDLRASDDAGELVLRNTHLTRL
jgi:superfamily II RNA helicase